MSLEKLKVVILGQLGVGKSTMINTYVTGEIIPALEPTSLTSFMSKTLKVRDKSIRIDI